MKKPPIYLFDHNISYKAFFALWSRFPAGCIVPTEIAKGKAIWEMIRDKQLYVYIDSLCKDDPMCIGTKLPKNRKICLITNPKIK